MSTNYWTELDSTVPAIHNVINIKAIKWVFNLQPLIVINEQADGTKTHRDEAGNYLLHQAFETGLKIKA